MKCHHSHQIHYCMCAGVWISGDMSERERMGGGSWGAVGQKMHMRTRLQSNDNTCYHSVFDISQILCQACLT